MRRCIDLAIKGLGNVAPNPMVGAVLVHENRIIGEGWHEKFGGPHAEVNCINSVAPEDKHLIPSSTIYVSLEPCNHQGKTPPCSDLIIFQGIKNVVIACMDPFEKVNGAGIRRLKENGVDVEAGICEAEATELNRRFFTFHTKQRPYVILKWAQSSDGFIAGTGGRTAKISNPITDRLVHKWRSEEAAIMVGTNTAQNDNPSLTTRLWPGNNPLRIFIDKQLRINENSRLLDNSTPTLIFNLLKEEKAGVNEFVRIQNESFVLDEMLQLLHQKNIQSLIVEGGNKLLQSFIDSGCWDEARVITAKTMKIGEGISSPVLTNAELSDFTDSGNDEIRVYKNIQNKP